MHESASAFQACTNEVQETWSPPLVRHQRSSGLSADEQLATASLRQGGCNSPLSLCGVVWGLGKETPPNGEARAVEYRASSGGCYAALKCSAIALVCARRQCWQQSKKQKQLAAAA